MAGGGDILGSGLTGGNAGAKALGSLGAGDPSSFLGAGGGFGFDPTTMGNIIGDPTGSMGAAMNLDAGASSPTDPGSSIGGAQSGAQTAGQGAQPPPQPAPQPQQASPDASSAMASAQQFMKPTSFQLGAPQSVAGPTGLEQQPASFNERFNAAPLSGAVQQTSPAQLANYWNNLDTSGAPGTQAAPNAVSVGLSNSADAAVPYARQSDAGQLPGTAGDLPDQPAADSGAPTAPGAQVRGEPTATQAAAQTGTQGAAGGQGQQNEPQTTGQGRGVQQQGAQQGGQQQQPQVNPERIIQALMQGGPMGALEELAREVMGQGGIPQGPGQYVGDQSQYANQVPRDYTRQNMPPWAPGYGPSTGIYTTAQRGSQAGAPQGPRVVRTQPAGAMTGPDLASSQGIPGGAWENPDVTANVPSAGSGGAIGSATPEIVGPQTVARSRVNGSDTRPTAGYSNFLRQQRATSARELQDPRLRLQVAGMMHLENDSDPIGPVESLLNRKAMTGRSLTSLLHGGFYGPINNGRLPAAMRALQGNPRLYQYYNRYIDAALSGSNVLGGATDQGLPTDPNGWNPSGRVQRGSEVYNDWSEYRDSANWRRQQQAQVQAELQQQPAHTALTQ